MANSIIEPKPPRYQQLLADHRHSFPLASQEGLNKTWQCLGQVKTNLAKIDPGRSIVPYLSNGRFRMAKSGEQDASKIIGHVLSLFNGLPNWAHPLTQMNLMPPTTAVGVVSAFLCSMFNPDICSPEFSGNNLVEAEHKVVKVLSKLVGYDPLISYGFFTYGGTFAIQQGIRLSLEKLDPTRGQIGQKQGFKVLCSERSHFAIDSAVVELGLGRNNVVHVKADNNGEMLLDDLDRKGRQILRSGEKIACVVATMGTTDEFGIDDISGINKLRTQWGISFRLGYQIPIHADAVIGWAWGFFRHYNFTANPLQFPRETLEAIQKIVKRIKKMSLADSVSLNPHKYGYAPIPASFILFKENGKSLDPIRRHPDEMPQLYGVDSRHPGVYTIETTRSPIGIIATLANFMLFGREGYQAMLGRIVEMGISLRKELSSIDGLYVINQDGLGGGTLFYFKRPGMALKEQNLLNQRIFGRLNEGNNGEKLNLSTAMYDGMIVLKSLIISPFIGPEDIREELRLIENAYKKESD